MQLSHNYAFQCHVHILIFFSCSDMSFFQRGINMFKRKMSHAYFSIKDCSSSLHRFQKYQDLPTRRASAVEQFSINGSLFLAFANHQSDIEGRNTDSFIYKLNDSTGTFFLYQTIDTTGARDIEYFMISDKHYLAVAKRLNGTTHQLNSVIYRWNGHEFVTLQNIPTNSATSFNFFEILQELFLAVTNSGGMKAKASGLPG